METKNKIGLGDIIERITFYTGIQKLVKLIWGKDCGCDKRQEELNKLKMEIWKLKK